jgi:hypothetical protein
VEELIIWLGIISSVPWCITRILGSGFNLEFSKEPSNGVGDPASSCRLNPLQLRVKYGDSEKRSAGTLWSNVERRPPEAP